MPGATKSRVRELRDGDSRSQSAHLATAIAADLAAALASRAAASLVVSGGRTPAAMLAQLSGQSLDWSRVLITLADERWVLLEDQASNEALVRAALLRGPAAAAHLIGLKNAAPTPAAGAARSWSALKALPRPFDVVLLGMGDDGHTASLFPDSPELAAGLDRAALPGCLAVHPPSAPHARLSLNLAALLQSRRIFVQISGAQKWEVYQRAKADGPVAAMPIRAILRQDGVPVDVYWCPADAERAR